MTYDLEKFGRRTFRRFLFVLTYRQEVYITKSDSCGEVRRTGATMEGIFYYSVIAEDVKFATMIFEQNFQYSDFQPTIISIEKIPICAEIATYFRQ